MNAGNVLPPHAAASASLPRRAPGEAALRAALAEGLAAVQAGAPDLQAADRLGWAEGTVRNVRNMRNTLSAKLISDAAFHSGGRFIAPWLALCGLRAVPLDVSRTADAPKVRLVGNALADMAEDVADGSISNAELAAHRGSIEAAGAVLDELRGRLALLDGARLRAAAGEPGG